PSGELARSVGEGLRSAFYAKHPQLPPLPCLQITGIWYVKAMVANKNLPLEKRPKKVSPLTVTALEGGDLEASFTFLKKDQCHEKGIVMERVGDPGKYIAKGGKKHIYLQELPVKDHYIILGECQHDERTFHMGKLLGRSLDVNVEALEEFRK
uniref:Lipocalin/cytosolic fatty-acid binding domain-containing protein n=1 Tax=Loxodonta africana TaxID=9785 RepID=G3U1P5_LOXAF